MSIIDQKGKLFGKLNVIDLIAILLILAVVALLGYKLTSNRDNVGGAGQPVVYTVQVKNVQPEIYENIKKELPSQLLSSDALQDAYVTDVQATPTQLEGFTMQNSPTLRGTIVTTSQLGNYDLVFTIEGTVKDNISSELGSQEIRVGRAHVVKTTTFELDGVILSCERPEADSTEAAE